MILSEQTRRWSEIQFYYFCLNIYELKKNMIDVILMVEVVCRIGQLNYPLLKRIAALIISSPHYMPNNDEIVSLASSHGMKPTEIKKATGYSFAQIKTSLMKKDKYIPFPQFSVTEDEELYKFNEIFQQLKKAGI